MLDYHGRRGLILFRKHLKSYFKDLPPTDEICSEMVVAKNTAEFDSLLNHLCEEFGPSSIQTLSHLEPEPMSAETPEYSI